MGLSAEEPGTATQTPLSVIGDFSPTFTAFHFMRALWLAVSFDRCVPTCAPNVMRFSGAPLRIQSVAHLGRVRWKRLFGVSTQGRVHQTLAPPNAHDDDAGRLSTIDDPKWRLRELAEPRRVELRHDPAAVGEHL